jgi:hypothetical protein
MQADPSRLYAKYRLSNQLPVYATSYAATVASLDIKYLVIAISPISLFIGV